MTRFVILCLGFLLSTRSVCAQQPAPSGTPARAQTSSCRPADSYGPRLVADLQKLVTATGPGVIAARDSLYHIPVVSPASITLVTDAQTCSRAAQALTNFEASRQVVTDATVTSAATTAASNSRTVVVAKVGTHWAVEDPNAAPHGRFLTVVLFDSRWRRVGGYTGP